MTLILVQTCLICSSTPDFGQSASRVRDVTLARPETRYAGADGVRIGYQCFGSGKRTLINVPGFAQNIDLIWEKPESLGLLGTSRIHLPRNSFR
jgi:hypothetical protein